MVGWPGIRADKKAGELRETAKKTPKVGLWALASNKKYSPEFNMFEFIFKGDLWTSTKNTTAT